uniref:Uncharacterized protein n=1 Tax=Nelumbo nucifera TaxID=4432 RepID=A0A822XMC2_NELNU|nr:TPA_asm: hypothetical protein HUJ06_022645 [Nelumbo nucifera]
MASLPSSLAFRLLSCGKHYTPPRFDEGQVGMREEGRTREGKKVRRFNLPLQVAATVAKQGKLKERDEGGENNGIERMKGERTKQVFNSVGESRREEETASLQTFFPPLPSPLQLLAANLSLSLSFYLQLKLSSPVFPPLTSPLHL